MAITVCQNCMGEGVVDKGLDTETPCPECKGVGLVSDDNSAADDREVLKT
jgi:DnaJ-class molecular chaperone